MISGVNQWQRESKGFKSGEKSRIDRIQNKLKKAIQDLELEGLDETGREIYEQTMQRSQTLRGVNSLGALKPIEVEYNHPPAQVQYTTEHLDAAELKSQTSEKKIFQRKVGTYVVDAINNSLKYEHKKP